VNVRVDFDHSLGGGWLDKGIHRIFRSQARSEQSIVPTVGEEVKLEVQKVGWGPRVSPRESTISQSNKLSSSWIWTERRRRQGGGNGGQGSEVCAGSKEQWERLCTRKRV